MAIEWSVLANDMREFGLQVYNAYNAFLAFVNTPLIDVIRSINDIVPSIFLRDLLNAIVDFLLANNELATMPLWAMLIGTGVIIVAVVSLVKWFIGIVT